MIRPLSKTLAAIAVCLGAAAPAAADAPRLDWRALPLPAIDGRSLDPAQLAGKVVLVVNTASQCGFTPQYKGLQALWREYRDKGVVILGIPSNDFGAQEPASNAEVAKFCEINYGVDFPLMAKQVVSGKDAHPLYRWAAERTGPLGVPRWNFHKLLIGSDGRLLDWFASTTAPDSAKLRAALDKAVMRRQ
ncbi:glutathione peroxidase [Magnetospirillum sp. SS-4]|uniref:glutathione peroxidase n=1 Tax=Magnetospirillum sp. SS-4 TaxID=2681465 RepID=UPI0013847EA3|nr:glutathione peroxidase [Magnetospirillum sp. SS-4]CAA7612710.1 Hydroperoxy fatty acid reductase gpx2 [Magnetospirillum sp. SS-4]